MTLDRSELRDALFLTGEEEEEAWTRLLAPGQLEQTRLELTALLNSVNNDLAARAAVTHSGDELKAWREWRGRALGFKRTVERRLQQTKLEAAKHGDARFNDRRQSELTRTALRALTTAVRRHQTASADAGISPEPHDVALWSTLDSLVVPSGERMCVLSDMLADGTWS